MPFNNGTSTRVDSPLTIGRQGMCTRLKPNKIKNKTSIKSEGEPTLMNPGQAQHLTVRRRVPFHLFLAV